MSNNELIQFGELFSESTRNGIYKSKKFQGHGTEYVKMGELFGNGILRVDELNFDQIELNGKEKEKLKLNDNDLLFSRTSVVADGVGKCVLVKKNTNNVIAFDSNIIRVRLDISKAEPAFYYYYFSSYIGREAVKGISGGSAVTTITGTGLTDLEVDYPSIERQKKVADILLNFDNLIENNTRRIAILEEMARLIYREWFVHYRYPGHEEDELVDSETEFGEVPEGWEVLPIDEIFNAVGGGTPRIKVDEYWEGGTINWFTPSDLTSYGRLYMADSERKITEKGLNNSSAKMFPPYSVMMTSRATLGVTAFNIEPASVNQGFIVCIPNEKVTAYQIYFWIQENLQRMINEASGATYKEITKTNFRKMNFPIIEENLNQEFLGKVEPLFRKIENLEKKNKLLKETRDLLLPKLISGEVEV